MIYDDTRRILCIACEWSPRWNYHVMTSAQYV